MIFHRLSIVVVLLAVACGGPQSTARGGADLEAIRARARDNPQDAAAQALWAEHELLSPGGDPELQAEATERAAALLPDDVEVAFLRATERHVHGDLDAALEAYLRAIAGAPRSISPFAPAIAEVSLAYLSELDDSVPGFNERVRAALEPVFDQPGAMGPWARHMAGATLGELAHRRGDMEEVHAIRARQGCVRELRVAGPFGPRHLLGFDQELAPEEPGPLAQQYDLGPSRGVRETRTIEGRGCTFNLGGGPVAGPGTTYSEAIYSVPAAGEYLVRVESPNSIAVFVDDEPLARVDRRSLPNARITYHRAQLAAGERRIMVKTTSRHPNPVLLLSVVRLDGTALDASGPTPDTSARELPEGRPLSALLGPAVYATRSDHVAAREAISGAAREPEATVPILNLANLIVMSDPLMGEQVASDEARRLMMQAATRDARAWYPRLALANLEPDELTKITMLERAMEQWPEVVLFPLTLIDSLVARGWSAREDEAIARARAIVPEGCRPRRALLSASLRRGRSMEVGRLAEELVEGCDARSDARLQHLVRQRRWTEAGQELARLQALEPRSLRFQHLDAALSLARSRGDEEEIARDLREMAALAPRNSAVTLLEADRLLAAGRQRQAEQRIESSLAEAPESMAALRRVLRAIGGEDPLRSFRLDGARVIREFEGSGRSYDGPKVLVLDYTVVRVFEDGSSLELTHNITRIQSEEAVDSEGEYTPPEDAQLLTLRTVKADGRLLEPDEIQGKETISMPSLAVGDYVEVEYLRPRPAPAGYPGGAIGDRFYFQSFETPFDRSELTLVVPESVHPRVEPRGPAPETEERVADGLRVLQWRVRESRPRPLEPGSTSSREYLPSILWGWNATWEAYAESFRDVLADRNIRDPAHVRLVREVGGEPSSGALTRARRIYHWVLENIEESDAPLGQAATMVHSRTGNRARVLAYLLELGGIPADLGIARSLAGDLTPAELADTDTFEFLVVRMRGNEGDVWLWPGARGAPFGYLPLEPAIRGQEAILLNGTGAERVRVGSPPIESDLARVEVDVRLDGDGGAVVETRETFQGTLAVAWRNQLEGVPAAQLEELFARQYVAQIAGGARMTTLRITGREDPDQPLVLQYAFEVESLGRLDRGEHVVPLLYPTGLARSLSRLARRTTPQMIAGVARDVIVRVHLSGDGAPSLPEERTLEGPGGARASWRASAAGNVVTLERSVRVPQARVAPEDYADFARFCRSFDEIEDFELRVRQ